MALSDTGGAHVPEHLLAPLVQALVTGLDAMQRRDGGPGRSTRELALWVSSLRGSGNGRPLATIERVDDMIGTREAARIAGCSQRNITGLIRSGRLDGRQVGRTWLVHRSQVAEYSAGRGQDADRN